jgi:hypothetical protein
MARKSFFEEFKREMDFYSPKPKFYSFVMSENEIMLFDIIVNRSKVYLEFGMGGSTLRTLQNSKANIYSIDSDLNWINLIRRYWIIRFYENRRLHLLHINIGRTKEWGYPEGIDSVALFPNYSANVFNIIKNKEQIDTVLIDGRFRVACTLRTIMECHLNRQLKIIIHDFWNRPIYFILLKYLYEINRADTLGVFRIRENTNLQLVCADYEQYKYDYR